MSKPTNEKEQVDIITNFFRNTFSKENIDEIEVACKPTEMKVPFTAEEVEDAAKSLKNNKSPGIDCLNAELIKYGPEEVFQEIADTLNEIAKTGESPNELTKGILVPIPKPGKPQGPPSNLRPVILLSVLRKILSICMLRRIGEKMYTVCKN